MSAPSSDNVLLGRGALYFDRYTSAGARTGYFHLGNCDQFGIGIETEKLSMRDYLQQTSANYKEVVINTDVNIAISGFEFTSHTAQLAFLGSSASLTQTEQVVTGEELAAATVTGLKGKYFETAYRQIGSITLTQGASTLVEGTDYEVTSAASGLIRILPTSPTVADGMALEIDYTGAAIATALEVVNIATVSEIEGKLKFVPNNTTGPDFEVELWRAALTPNGEIGFISDEFAKFALEGKALSDATGTYGGSSASPYGRIIKLAA